MSQEQSFDELLIISVEKHRNLYDKKSKGFKDKVMKENSWSAIAEVCNAEGMYCRQLCRSSK